MFQKRGRISYTVSEPHFCAVFRPPIQILKKELTFLAGVEPNPDLSTILQKLWITARRATILFLQYGVCRLYSQKKLSLPA